VRDVLGGGRLASRGRLGDGRRAGSDGLGAGESGSLLAADADLTMARC
jgi:hypothetical protein